MSIHSSLKGHKNKSIRSVRKRYERLKALLEKEKDVLSVFALPKEKIIRLKIKKEKKEETSSEGLTESTKEAEKKTMKKGCGLTEVLIVIAILLFISAIFLPSIIEATKKAEQNQAPIEKVIPQPSIWR